MNAITHRALEREADRILRADNDNNKVPARTRFRGGRPALTWLAKHNGHGAACLWQVARQRLPNAANDNRSDAVGMGVDRRVSGKPRGQDAAPRSNDAYLSLPAIAPRLGDADRAPTCHQPSGNGHEEPRITIKPQRPELPFSAECRFGYCAPVIAAGALFIGAVSGLGQPRPASRGDVRCVDVRIYPAPPVEIDVVIEAVLARATVAGVGEALGARGGYADRKGAKALTRAAVWAIQAVSAKSRPLTP